LKQSSVDARKVKNVSGRKNDVLDCQWLQELESYGLLAGAFRPADEIVILRGYMRQRQMLVKTAAIHIQHMQKALQQMNLRLDNVVADITGQTGMRILKALLAISWLDFTTGSSNTVKNTSRLVPECTKRSTESE
jgi:hypothetical protein